MSDDNEEINEPQEDEDIEEDTSCDSSEVETLKTENEELSRKILELNDKYLRLAAEYKNYQERSKKEKIRIHSDAISDVVSVLLPTVDDIERTLPMFSEMEEKYSKGVNMILKKMHDSLKKLGVESFGEIGDEFDPSIHNASSKSDESSDDGKTIISDVYQKGYKIGGRLIRAAMVQVSG